MALDQVKEGELQKWDEEGTKVEGILLSYESKTTGKGEGNVYEVKTAAGIVPFFAPQLLHKKLKNVPTGNVVSITYVKKTKTGTGNDLKHFEVAQGAPTAENLASVGLTPDMQQVEGGADDINFDENKE